MEHLEPVTVEPLPFPVSFGDMPCITFRATEQAARSRFGEPHQRSKEDELFGEPGPCVYWAFKYSCGLELAVTYHLHADWIEVSANELDVEHVLGHLDMPTPQLWKLDVGGGQELSG
jgi:hypothetical protein